MLSENNVHCFSASASERLIQAGNKQELTHSKFLLSSGLYALCKACIHYTSLYYTCNTRRVCFKYKYIAGLNNACLLCCEKVYSLLNNFSFSPKRKKTFFLFSNQNLVLILILFPNLPGLPEDDSDTPFAKI